MNPDNERESTTPRRRESRAGARKVTSLTAEQLDRKRANDREAQRTIRQRTKEHIESLEHEVAELRAKTERFDEVVRHNAALDEEIRRLRHQLAVITGSPTYDSSNMPSMPIFPSHYPAPFGGATDSISSASSVLQSPHGQVQQQQQQHHWQSYGSASPAAMGQSPKTDYSGNVEPYMLQGQFQPPAMHHPASPMPFSPDHRASFNLDSDHVHLSDPTPQQLNLQYYQVSSDFPQRPGGTPQRNLSQGATYDSSQRSLSVPTVPGEAAALSAYSTERPRTHRFQAHQRHPSPSDGESPRGESEYPYTWTAPN